MTSPALLALAERARVQPPMKLSSSWTLILCRIDEREAETFVSEAACIAAIASGEMRCAPYEIIRMDDDCPPRKLDLAEIALAAWKLLERDYVDGDYYKLPTFIQNSLPDLDERISDLLTYRKEETAAYLRAVGSAFR